MSYRINNIPLGDKTVAAVEACQNVIPTAKPTPWILVLIGLMLSALITLIQIPLTLYRMIKIGPKALFGKARNESPDCLRDSSLGKHCFFQKKDVILHYVIQGQEGKPLMVFLHGFPELWYSWRHQIREFSKDYRTVAVDMRGYSESGKPNGIKEYSVDKIAQDIAQLIAALGYENCVMVAHDWGGVVAQYVTSFYPDKVQRLVLCNIGHPKAFYKSIATSWKQRMSSWYILFFQIPFFPEFLLSLENYKFVERALKSSRVYSQEQLIEEDAINAIKCSLSQPGGLTSPLNYYRAALRYKAAPLQPTIDTPTLMVWGVHDRALLKNLATLSAKYFSDFDLQFIDNASHFVQQERPLEVNKFIKSFLDNN